MAERDERSMALRFAEDEMVFNDIPSTLEQNIMHGTIVFSDGSYLVCHDGAIYETTEPGIIPIGEDFNPLEADVLRLALGTLYKEGGSASPRPDGWTDLQWSARASAMEKLARRYGHYPLGLGNADG